MKIARPGRAAFFAALALASLVGLGFGIAVEAWPLAGRTAVELIGYVLFVIFALETEDACRRGSDSPEESFRRSRRSNDVDPDRTVPLRVDPDKTVRLPARTSSDRSLRHPRDARESR